VKKTLPIDEALLKKSKLTTGAASEAVLRQAAYQDLRALRGSEPDAQDVPRRREKLQSQ
jgi:hypothetical protein